MIEIRDNSHTHIEITLRALPVARVDAWSAGWISRVEQLGVVLAADEFKFKTKHNSPSLARLIAGGDGLV